MARIIVLFVVVGRVNPRFLSNSNLTNIFSGNAYIAVAAIGMSIVIITGHIDVSVGSLIGVLATIAGTLAVSGYPVWIAWDVPVIVGVVINTTGRRIHRLSQNSLDRHDTRHAVDPERRPDQRDRRHLDFGMPPEFFIAQARLFGIPSPVYFMVVLTIIMALWMRYSATGPLLLCGRRQSGSGARQRPQPRAHLRARLRAAWLLCRHRGACFSPRNCR